LDQYEDADIAHLKLGEIFSRRLARDLLRYLR
jgi:hypothetical protein